jgi:hypothetical protein
MCHTQRKSQTNSFRPFNQAKGRGFRDLLYPRVLFNKIHRKE